MREDEATIFQKAASVLRVWLNLLTPAVVLFGQCRVVAKSRLVGYVWNVVPGERDLVCGWLVGGRERENRKEHGADDLGRTAGISSLAGTPAALLQSPVRWFRDGDRFGVV